MNIGKLLEVKSLVVLVVGIGIGVVVLLGYYWLAEQGPQSVSLLFVQTATSGSLTNDSSGALTLTLENVSPSTVWFTNRPRRLSGQVPTSAFVATSWNVVGFQNDSPNGAIEAEFEDGAIKVVTLDLSKPRYDERTRRLTYIASLLEGTPTEIVRQFHNRADLEARGKFTNASLFIDDAAAGILLSGMQECGNEIIYGVLTTGDVNYHPECEKALSKDGQVSDAYHVQ